MIRKMSRDLNTDVTQFVEYAIDNKIIDTTIAQDYNIRYDFKLMRSAGVKKTHAINDLALEYSKSENYVWRLVSDK